MRTINFQKNDNFCEERRRTKFIAAVNNYDSYIIWPIKSYILKPIKKESHIANYLIFIYVKVGVKECVIRCHLSIMLLGLM